MCAIAAALVLSPAASAQQGVLKTPAAPETVKSSRSKHKTAARDARHFRELSSRLPPVAFTAVAVDPADPEVILVGSDGFVFKSDDGGDVWRPVFSFARGLPQANLLLPLVDLNGDEVNDAITDELMGIGITGGVIPDGDELAEIQGIDEDALQPSDPDDDDDDPDDAPDGDLPAGDANTLVDPYAATGAAAVFYPRQRPGVRSLVFESALRATVYAATPRGLFKSVDAGDSFQQVFLPLPEGDAHTLEKILDVRDVAIHPKDPSRMWVGTGGGLLFSNNGGSSFSWATGKLHTVGVLDLDVVIENKRAVVLVGTEEGAFRSTDDGQTFQQMMLQGASAFEPVLSVAYDVRERITYAGSAHGLYVSERGASILERRPNLSATLVTSMSIDPKRLGGLAVGLQDRGVLLLEDRGYKVVRAQSLPVHWTSGIARLPGDGDTVIVSTEKGIFAYEKGEGLLMLTDNLQKLRRRWGREPSLRETVELALDAQQLSPRLTRSMLQRSRVAPFLPRLRVRADLQYSYRRQLSDELLDLLFELGFDIDDPDTRVIIDGVTYDSLDDLATPTIGWDVSVMAWANWSTEEWILPRAEPAIIRLSPRMSRQRERLLARVVDTYHARRRLLTQVFSAKSTVDVLAHQLIKLSELTALLDAYTEGSFSRLARERGAPVDDIDDQALDSISQAPTVTRTARIARTTP